MLNKKGKLVSLSNIAILIAIIVIAILPFLLTKYRLHMVILMCIWLIAAIALGLLVGYVGKMSFAHAALMGVAGYTSALLTTKLNVPFLLAALLGICLSGVFGFLIGVITLRLKGHFFAIVTLAFGRIYTLVINNWESVTNGGFGVKGISFPTIGGLVIKDYKVLYYIMVILCLCCFAIVHRIVKSQYGRRLIAIREDEDLAECMGINVTRDKVTAFVISSMMAGLAGVMYAHYIRYLSPDCYTGDDSTLLVLMVILGGIGTQIGPLLGTIIIIFLPQLLYAINDYRMIIFGVMIILIITFMPRGLMGVIMDCRKKLSERAKDGKIPKSNETAD